MTFFTLSHTSFTSPSPLAADRPFTWVSAWMASETMSLRNWIWVTAANAGVSPVWPSTLVTVMVTLVTATFLPRLMEMTLCPAVRPVAWTPSGAKMLKGTVMVPPPSSSTRAEPAWMAPSEAGVVMVISLISVGGSRAMGRESSLLPWAGERVTVLPPVKRSSAVPPLRVTAPSSTAAATMAAVERIWGSPSRPTILLT